VGVAAEPPPRTVALTFDDLPFLARGLPLLSVQTKSRALLDALRARQVPAIGFVNEDKLLVAGEMDARTALLSAWLEAGMELGNHGFGHLRLGDVPLGDCEAAVLKGEVVTRWLLEKRGRAPRYYRHPYTQTGPSAEVKRRFEAFLAEHGYAVAPFTIENSDYVFDWLYAAARAKGDAAGAERLRQAYLDYNDTMVAFFEAEAQQLFGRPIAQILLLHANLLNADSMPELLDRLARRGYRFVTLDAALADPAYATPDGYIGPAGPSWIHRWRAGTGDDAGQALRREPDPPAWVLEAFRQRGRAAD
jgi:peptidoglycan/xylan/chitin deacetylase (PgdA/CDA1 family)